MNWQRHAQAQSLRLFFVAGVAALLVTGCSTTRSSPGDVLDSGGASADSAFSGDAVADLAGDLVVDASAADAVADAVSAVDVVADSASDAGSTPGGDGGLVLSRKHPNDIGIGSDPAVLFHSDFENDLAGFTDYTKDSSRIAVLSDPALANGGAKYLQARITKTHLASSLGPYVAAMAQYTFSRRSDIVYWRFYAKFVGQTAVPHHWVRLAAGTVAYSGDGLANTVPAGNAGFWFDLDAHDDGRFSFYTYWYKMRSGRCNDGSVTPGCAGDQGTSYHYGNSFKPANQTPFSRDRWMCVEVKAKANTVGQSNGELALWIDDQMVGEYKPGAPRGRWLRDSFLTWGPYFVDQQAFEGFDFRSSSDVMFKRITLDAYYERESLAQRERSLGITFPEAQIILYDDVVVATERVGCKVR